MCIRESLRASGLKTKREIVELRLQTVVRLKIQSGIRSLRGKLDEILDSEPLPIGDLKLTEVLQGFLTDKDFERARDVLTSLNRERTPSASPRPLL
jgi:hypothetical protein